MREKLLIPAQFFGLGDCIFIITLLRKLAGDTYKILYPVMPNYVEGLQRAYPDITFIPFTMVNVNYHCKEEYENEHYRYLPIRFAESVLGLPYTSCMSAKYSLFGLDYRTWKDNAKYERDFKLESLLMDSFKIEKGEKYNLINRYFGSDYQYKVDINVDNGLRNIEMQSDLKFISLFDWSSIIENATTIHVANSSILYLLELLELKAESVNLYCRKPQESNFDNTSYLHSKEYILHY